MSSVKTKKAKSLKGNVLVNGKKASRLITNLYRVGDITYGDITLKGVSTTVMRPRYARIWSVV